jgi:vitamin B12 transporter
MKKNYVRIAVGLGFAQLALLSIAANAQDTTRVLKDVVVSATKVDQKQSQIGKTVTIITREQLERSSGKSVAELLGEQAGIVVNGAGSNPGLNKDVFLRGADNKYTLILLDGVLVSDPSGLGGAFDIRLLSIDQIDHIEILKGGQSTLYGSDAVAGVINIVTKKNATSSPSINGIATAGSYGTLKGSLGLNAQLKNLSYNIIYSHERSDGVSEAARPDTATKPYDKDGYNQDAVNAQFRIKFTDRFNVNPFIRYLYGNYKYDDGGFTDANNSFVSKHLNVGTNAVYRLDKGSFNLNYSYENTNRVYNDAFGSSPFVGRLNFADFYFNHQIGDHIKILAGIDNRYSQMNASGKSKVDSSANLLGAYTSVFLSNIDSIFNLEAGGRYNHQSKYGSNWTYSVTPSFNVLKNEKLKLFGTVSTSFKAPDLSALFGQYGPNPNLKPERSHSYEAGISTKLFDDAFKLRVVAYKRNISEAIIYLYPQGYLNQDKQNVKGIEIEPSLNLGKLTLSIYYTYINAQSITKDSLGKPVVQNYLYRVPKNTFGAFAGVKATKKLYISVNYRNYGQRTDLFYNSNTFGNELQSLKSYNLVDAYAEYAFLNKQLKIFIDVKNIFNEKYAELYGYTALGTNFNAGLSFNIH